MGLEGGDLVDASLVATSLERGRKHGIHCVESNLATDDSFAEADHVCRIVSTSEHGGGHIVYDRSPDTDHLVGGDRDPNASAADAQTELDVSRTHGTPNSSPKIWVVDGHFGRVGAKIDNVMTMRGQVLDHVALEAEACVVRTDGDTHGLSVPTAGCHTRSLGSMELTCPRNGTFPGAADHLERSATGGR